MKEIKPTAAISWKSIGFGPVPRRGVPMERGDAIRPVRVDQAFVDRSPGLIALNFDRSWDNVRDDPRFLEAVERVGLRSGL